MRKGGESGPAIVPKQPEKSVLWERVTSKDETEFMPPQHEGEPLNAEQILMLKEWIAAGALHPANEKPETDPRDHWAFRPRVRPPVPAPKNAAWVRSPIDAFPAQFRLSQTRDPRQEASRSRTRQSNPPNSGLSLSAGIGAQGLVPSASPSGKGANAPSLLVRRGPAHLVAKLMPALSNHRSFPPRRDRLLTAHGDAMGMVCSKNNKPLSVPLSRVRRLW